MLALRGKASNHGKVRRRLSRGSYQENEWKERLPHCSLAACQRSISCLGYGSGGASTFHLPCALARATSQSISLLFKEAYLVHLSRMLGHVNRMINRCDDLTVFYSSGKEYC